MNRPYPLRALFASASTLLLIPSSAWACSYSPLVQHEIVADPSDVTPPETPQAEILRIKRGKGPEGGCLSQSGTSCDDIAYVELALSAEDDISTEDSIGYEIVVQGDAPEALGRNVRVVSAPDGEVRFHWEDGEGTRDIRFDLHIRSVDRAGNISEEATILHVRSDGSSGCAAGRDYPDSSWLLVLLAALASRFRRTDSR